MATDAEEKKKDKLTARVATVCGTPGYAHTRLLQSISRSGYVPPQALTLHYITSHTFHTLHPKRQERKASLRRRVVACAAVRLCARVGTLRDTRRPFFDLTTFARTPSVKHRMLEARWWSWSGNLSSFLWPNGLPDLHFEVQMEPK